jgi:hypothetical protein
VGRKNTFPLLVFGVVLVTALAAILSINYLLGGPKLHLPDTALTGQGDLAIPTDVYASYAAPVDLRLGSSAPYATAIPFIQNDDVYINLSVKTEPGVLSQYVYKTGKYSQSNAWQDFTFATAPVPGSPWIVGNATVILGPFVGNYTEYIAVFVCRKYTANGNYVCGPKSISSEAKNWTLTNFTVPVVCVDDSTQFCLSPVVLATANMSNGTGICATGKLCYKCAPNTNNASGGCFAPTSPPAGTTCTLKAGQFCTKLSGTQYNFSAQNTTGTCGSDQDMKCFSCAATFANQTGGCFKTCTDVCAPGDTTCEGQKIKSCTQQETGCYAWGIAQTCSDPTRICETGTLGTGCFPPTCISPNFCAATAPVGATALSGRTCLGTNTCFTCGTGKTNCNGVCVDLQTNSSNCGQCGRTIGASEICVNGNPTCGGCNINGVCIQSGQAHPTNSCLSCNLSKAVSSWSVVNLPATCTGGTCDATGTCTQTCTPTCPAANTVNCGVRITPSNNCGTCAGNGTVCPSGQSCSTNTWTCVNSCTPTASGCVYANSCSTTGTDNCGNANAAICNRQTNTNPCTINGQQSTCLNGACQTPVCTNNDVRCVAPPPYAAAYSRIETCQNGQWQTTQTCMNSNTCSADGRSCGTPWCTSTNGGVEKCDGLDNNCNGETDEGNTCTNGCSYEGTDIASAHLKCPNAGCTNSVLVPYLLSQQESTFNNKFMGVCCSGATDCLNPTTKTCAPEGTAWSYSMCSAKSWYSCYDGVTTLELTINSQKYKCDTEARIWFKCGGANQPLCSRTTACTYNTYNGGAGPTPPKGTDWNSAPVVTGTSSACCDLTQCADTSQCYEEGILPGGNHWICATGGSQSQAAWYTCTAAKAGQTFYSNGGQNYCCIADPTFPSGYKFSLC